MGRIDRYTGVRRSSNDPPHSPLVLLSANSVWNIVNFRMGLMRALQARGYRIAVAAPAGDGESELRAFGIDFLALPMRATGTSPLSDLALLARYVALLRRARPAAFLGFTAKPNIYGSLAATLCGIPAINNLTGLGTAFIHRPRLRSLVSFLYRLALRRSAAVFFHNPDDRDLFVARRLVTPDQARLIPGSGVDLDHFAPAPQPPDDSAPTFLFIGRLLREKGIEEFVEAARAVRRVVPAARFQILGAIADDPRGVTAGQVEQWANQGLIDYLGTAADVRPFVARAHCVVLPSYREGMPRSLLEASAIARPMIACDVPGCRHLVEDGRTGLLCAARSPAALAEAMFGFLRLSAEQRSAMGRRARARVEEHFGEQRVSDAYIAALEQADLAVSFE